MKEVACREEKTKSREALLIIGAGNTANSERQIKEKCWGRCKTEMKELCLCRKDVGSKTKNSCMLKDIIR